MKHKPLVYPSQEQLHEIFEYCIDNISQPLLWKIKPNRFGRVNIGDVAGGLRKSDGYCRVKTGGQHYQFHRIVWIYHNGDILDGMQIDHIDGNPLNNLIENLRLATPSQNMHNRKKQSNNKSGIVGVRERDGKAVAEIKINGKQIWLGTFDTIEEAAASRKAAKEKYHGEFYREE
jgi:hypothetical protein